MSKYILSIDQGTTSTRACLFDKSGHLVEQAQKEFRQIYPQAGWVEHDPEEIWQSVVYCLDRIFSKIAVDEIHSIGITNQRETVVMWDKKTGLPVYNAIVWQCRRTTEFCKKLKKVEKKIHKITGLLIDPYFSASKINWVLRNSKKAQQVFRQGNLLVGTIDTYLIWKLTSGSVFATDVTNASRTMLMDLKTCQWSPECLKIFSIKKEILPEIRASNSYFGDVRAKEFGSRLREKKISIYGVAGDQQAALFGQACFKEGSAKCTFGTGSFILFNTGHKISYSRKGLLSTVAWKLESEKTVYALEGGAFVCGAAITWLKEGLGIINSSDEVESLAMSVMDTEGVCFVPALAGLGAPYWDSEARGMITGITRKTTKAHLVRATLEAMSLQNVDIISLMIKETKKKLTFLKTDGGAVKNNLLMQFQADFLGANVTRSEIIETTAIGAAFFAGLGSGFWSSTSELSKIWKANKEFTPKLSKKQRELKLVAWKSAVQKVMK